MTIDPEHTGKVGIGNTERRDGVGQYDGARVLIVGYEGQVRSLAHGDIDYKLSATADVEAVLRAFPPPEIVLLDRRILDPSWPATPHGSAADTAASCGAAGVGLVARLLKAVATASREAKNNASAEN